MKHFRMGGNVQLAAFILAAFRQKSNVFSNRQRAAAQLRLA